MTDWNQMTEQFHNTMQAIDNAHEASQGLRENANVESFEHFRNRMQELTTHLKNLEIFLDHPEAYAVDELAVWLNKTFDGKYTETHHLPHLEQESPR